MPGENWKRGLTARDMMVESPWTVGPDDPVFETVQMMLKRKLSGVPVVEEDRRLVGVLSEKGCIRALMRAVLYRMPPSVVRDVMMANPATVTEGASLLTVAQLFLQNDLRRVPVVSEGRLVGQISRSDLLDVAVKVFREAPSRHAAVLYLSALGERSSAPPG
jgi:CBS domain-containing protein